MIDVLMCSFYGKAYVVRTYMGLIESQNIYETLSFLFVKGLIVLSGYVYVCVVIFRSHEQLDHFFFQVWGKWWNTR